MTDEVIAFFCEEAGGYYFEIGTRFIVLHSDCARKKAVCLYK